MSTPDLSELLTEPYRRRLAAVHRGRTALEAGGLGEPALTIFCVARNDRGDQCNRSVATLYKFERTHLVVSQFRPAVDGVMAVLNHAMDVQQRGPVGRYAAEMMADQATEPHTVYNLVDEPPNVPVVPGGSPLMPVIDLGCPNHGVVRVVFGDFRILLKKAKKEPARRKAELDMQTAEWRIP